MINQKIETRQTLSGNVRDEIRRRIIRGMYRPGQPLRETELETQLGVSRGPVREALRLLIPTGLVDYTQWKGFKVKKYSASSIERLYRVRALMEGMLVEELKTQDISHLLQGLETRLQTMKAHLGSRDVNGYFDENLAFHQDIIEASGDGPMIQILNNINEICLPARCALIHWVFPNEQAANCHEDILACLKKRDFASARKLTEEHVLEDLEPVKHICAAIEASDVPERRRSRRSRKPGLAET